MTDESTEGDRQQIKSDLSTQRRFYCQIPNIVFSLGLSAYELALYCAIRRTAGENGVCYRSGQNLADLAGMSTGMVSRIKRNLARARFELN